MRIKKILLHGFKTFAQKTDLLFDPGITAIVGPNGSGKSNVADGVRWCLGEQSFSLLRSKKSSDVIFAGSDRKSRLGMAAVSLVLDNGGGELGLDFAEIEISRRTYQDGENEYLINSQKVRLSDVNELLAPSGLGNRTYAVIGQGLIDRVLSLKPEERRSLFEEAAGITGYQSKRLTTLRRLEATQKNLVRVHDIVAEISPRLKYLERQAHRYQEYAQIQTDLRQLLRQWHGFRWHSTLQSLETDRQSERTLRAEVESRRLALAAMAQRSETLRCEQAALRNALAALGQTASAERQRAQEVTQELAVARERTRQLQLRRAENSRELDELSHHLARLEGELESLQAALLAAQAEYQARQAQVQTQHGYLEAQLARRRGWQQAVDQARQQVGQLQNRNAERGSQQQQLQERRAALLMAQGDQTAALESAHAEVANRAAALESALAAVNADESSATRLHAALQELEDELAAARADLAAAAQEQQAAQRSADRLQTRYDLLARLRLEGAGYASGVRSVLQAAESATAGRRLTGIVGTVAAALQVPAALDKAIETAVGGALQHVITDSWASAQAAIAFLKESRQGRATFLPLDRLHVPSPLPAPRRPGLLGNAADLVTYDPAVAPPIQQLLNRVWIAADLPAARQALDEIRAGPRPTLVTVSGEIVRPGGSVTGGEDRHQRDESVLAREREFRELPAQLQQWQRQLQAADQEQSRRQAAIQSLNGRRAQQQHALAAVLQAERQRREEAQEVQRSLDRAQQALRWQEELLAKSTTELARLDEQEARLQTELAQLATEQAAAATALATAEKALTAQRSDELMVEMADLRAAAMEAQGELTHRRSQLESRTEQRQALGSQVAIREQRQAQLGTDLAELAQGTALLAEEQTKHAAALAALQQELQPKESRLTQLEQIQTEQESQERAGQLSLRREESAWNGAQLKLQRTEDSLETLRLEIQHDFGLVALEQSPDLVDQPPLPLASLVEELPTVETVAEGLEAEVQEVRSRLQRLGNVNADAPTEYEEAINRHQFLFTQSEDLEAAAANLEEIIRELDAQMSAAFQTTFEAVAQEFVHFFQLLFSGGTARLTLSEPHDLTHTGIEIIARPPGKRPQSLALLSGGERSLTALALIFAILRVSPTPFCILDEVDAALDEANVDRFRDALRALSRETQFILITHNRRTLETADTIYGISMGNDGVSKVISLRLDGDQIVHKAGDNAGEEKAGNAAELAELISL